MEEPGIIQDKKYTIEPFCKTKIHLICFLFE